MCGSREQRQVEERRLVSTWETFEPHGCDCQHLMEARCANSVQPTDDTMEIIGAGEFRFALNGDG